MTDKEYKLEVKRIRKFIKKWVRPLGLDSWTISFTYFREEREPLHVEYAPKSVDGVWRSAFVTCADFYYLTASIDCYLLVTRQIKDDELEEYFVHELMHIFLRSMHTTKMSAFEEQVATQLSQAFLRVRRIEKS